MSSISFSYDRIDFPLYLRASKAACQPKKGKGVPKVFVWIAFFIAMVVFFGLVNRLEFIRNGGPAYFAGLASMWLIMIGVAKANQKRFRSTFEEDQFSRGPVEIELSAEGMRATSSFGTTLTKWRAVDAVVDLKDGIGLQSGLTVYPLPKTAFPTDRTEAEILAQIEAWVASA